MTVDLMHVQCPLRPVMPHWIPLASSSPVACRDMFGGVFPWALAFTCGPEVVHSCLCVVSSSLPLPSLLACFADVFVGCYDVVATFQQGRMPRLVPQRQWREVGSR